MKAFPFTKTNELLVPPPQNGTPFDYFRLLCDDNFLNNIVSETNRYAVEILFTAGQYERSRISLWKELTVPEFLRFLGVLFHTGTVGLNRLQDYWKTHRLFNFKCFSDHIGRDRFMNILRCLHFATNPGEGDPMPEDRLFKIRPVLDYFNDKMAAIYYPSKTLSLDESMMLWRGRLVFRQYIKNKRHKYGIKLYMLTEPKGLIIKFAVYTGQLDDLGGTGHAEKVVFHLAKEKLSVGHSLYLDNYYNSYGLARKLLEKQTYCTGTLLGNRRGTPKDVVSAKLKKGEVTGKYLDGVLIAKWKDKRDVTYISTEFENSMVETTNKRGQLKNKPLPIVEYNKYMSGVDMQDQMMSYYPCSRKTLRWYKKLGIHILQLLLLNSFFLYNKYSGKKLNFYEYRLSVIEVLLPEVSAKPVTKKAALDHLPTKIENTNKKGHTLRKRCKVCSQDKRRKDTMYHCQACPEKPGLCLENCFKIHHSEK